MQSTSASRGMDYEYLVALWLMVVAVLHRAFLMNLCQHMMALLLPSSFGPPGSVLVTLRLLDHRK
jgi:hypothetical protein